MKLSSETLPINIVSIFTQVLLLGALVFCYLTKNDQAMTIIIGAIVANATTVVNFFLGSSSSSQKKDVTIAGLSGIQPPTSPDVAVIVPPPPAQPTVVPLTPAGTGIPVSTPSEGPK